MTIDIKVQLELLKELQVIDMHVKEVEEELAGIPLLLEEAKSDWDHANSELKAKEAEKAQAEALKRRLEGELEDEALRLKDRENKLYAIKTNKEYQAALKEIADGKKANKDREEAVIKIMEGAEKLSKEITQLSQQAADKESEYRKDEEELLKKQKEIAKEMEIRSAELEKIEKNVERSTLEKYNFIKTRIIDPLALVKNGICQGCNMNIPPQMFIELLKGLKFHFCPNCHRFIIGVEEAEEKGLEGDTNED